MRGLRFGNGCGLRLRNRRLKPMRVEGEGFHFVLIALRGQLLSVEFEIKAAGVTCFNHELTAS